MPFPTRKAALAAAAAFGLLALAACSSGGGGAPGAAPQTSRVTLPEGHSVASGSFSVPAGRSVERGGVRFSCAAGARPCAVTVDPGSGVARATGGRLTVARVQAVTPTPQPGGDQGGGEMQPEPPVVDQGGGEMQPEPPVVEWPDWPLQSEIARTRAGGLLIEDMSSSAILDRLKAVGNPLGNSDVYATGNMYWWFQRNVEFRPVMTGAGNIPLFQARTSDERFTGSARLGLGNAPNGLVGYGGWMDYGYFIMALWTEKSHLISYNPESDEPYETTAKGYGYRNYDYSDEVNFPKDMHWHGTMVGTDKRLSETNFVQGTVYMTVRDGARYNSKVEVDFKNIVNLSTGQIYFPIEWENAGLNQGGGFITSTQGVPPGTTFSLYADITGPRGEEVVGKFDRDSLVGVFGANVFGAKQHTCIPTPCVH